MLYLEAQRLDLLKQRVWVLAMRDGNLPAASVYVKASERLASLVGMNAPLGHVVNVIGAAPEPEQTQSSTHRLLETIRLLRAEVAPETGESLN